jgi:hypothetical protein
MSLPPVGTGPLPGGSPVGHFPPLENPDGTTEEIAAFLAK